LGEGFAEHSRRGADLAQVLTAGLPLPTDPTNFSIRVRLFFFCPKLCKRKAPIFRSGHQPLAYRILMDGFYLPLPDPSHLVFAGCRMNTGSQSIIENVKKLTGTLSWILYRSRVETFGQLSVRIGRLRYSVFDQTTESFINFSFPSLFIRLIRCSLRIALLRSGCCST
jgi:hypothetical protein